jgi:hypothetical protein
MNIITTQYLEDKLFWDYLHKNLVKQTKAYARRTTGSDGRRIASVALISRWEKHPDKACDDMHMFIADGIYLLSQKRWSYS